MTAVLGRSPACEGKPWLKFLQSLAKKVHSKESDGPQLPLSHPTPVPSKVRGASACNLVKNDISQDDKDAILWNHNKLRLKVANGQQSGQPTASNMMALVIIN